MGTHHTMFVRLSHINRVQQKTIRGRGQNDSGNVEANITIIAIIIFTIIVAGPRPLSSNRFLPRTSEQVHINLLRLSRDGYSASLSRKGSWRFWSSKEWCSDVA